MAVTNSVDHLSAFYELLGRPCMRSSFLAEHAQAILQRHFASVERRDAHGWLVFSYAETAQSYVASLVLLEGARVQPIEGPIRVRRLPSIFIAERA